MTLHRIRSSAAVALGLLACPSSASATQDGTTYYQLTDVGTYHFAVYLGMNEAGQIATSDEDRDPYLWDDGVVTPLPSLTPTGFESAPTALNDTGQIVGFGDVGVLDQPCLWRDGQVGVISVPGAEDGMALDVNDSGVIVGDVELLGGGTQRRGFLHENGVTTVLPTFGGSRGALKAINDAGVAVGGATEINSTKFQPFLYVDGEVQRFDGPFGDFYSSMPIAISESGIVVGYCDKQFGNGFVAFQYTGGEAAVALPEHPLAETTYPWGVNSAGVIVGWIRDASSQERAIVYVGGQPHLLEDLVVGDGDWDLLAATAINEEGQIAGYGIHEGELRAFRLEPMAAPEPYCEATTNSSSLVATLRASGPPSLSEGQFEVRVENAVSETLGLLFYNSTQVQTPFGDGWLCVGSGSPGIYRVGTPVQLDVLGSWSTLLDFDSPPLVGGPGAITPDSAWNFQFYFRDPSLVGGAGFNLTDALHVRFYP